MEVRSVEAVVRALNAVRVNYLVVGGVAVNAHGFVRLTREVDIVLQLTPDNASKGVQALLDISYQSAVPERLASFANEAARTRWREEESTFVLKLRNEGTTAHR